MIKKIKKPKEKISGNNIRKLLNKKGMSQIELADILEIKNSYLSIIISGKRKCLSLPIAMNIAKALNEPIENVFVK